MADTERRKQIRREIDQYIAQRRKGGWSLFETKKDESPLHPNLRPYDKDQKESENDQAEDVQDEYEEEMQEGFFSRMLKGLFGTDEKMEADEAMEGEKETPLPGFEETKKDLKEVATISLNVMRDMPGDQIREFKKSPDYDKFKSILRKHKLIK